MRTGFLPVLLFLVFSISLQAEDNFSSEKIKSIANSNRWLNLLHYQNKMSEVDDDRFFISRSGRTNPEQEIIETLNRYQTEKLHCRFPARLKYLSEHFSLNLNWELCSEYTEWKSALKPEGISLVFTSFYPENPASAFGHLLLKINQNHLFGLLDYSVNFSAQTGEDNGINYAYKGLTGRYRGIFQLEKYYIKVKEYKHYEARDLWEYPLPLSHDSLELFIDHLWEIIYSASFNYYFLDKNCSYQIVRLLDLVSPSEAPSKKLFYHNPSDDLERIVGTFNANTPVFRPSLYHQTKVSLDSLNRKDYKVLKKVIRYRKKIEMVDDPKILLAINDFLTFKKESMRNGSDKDEELHYQTLLKISKINIDKNAEPDYKEFYNPPHLAHHSKRVQASFFQNREQMIYSFRHRFALHHFMDNDAGYLINSHLNLMDLEARYFQKDNILKVSELVFLETQTFTPLSIMRTKPSWSFDLSYRSPYELRCDYCGLSQGKVGRGLTVETVHNKVYVWGFFNGYMQMLNKKQTFVDRFRFGPQLEIGLVWRLANDLKWQIKILENFNFVEQYAYESLIGETTIAYSMGQNLSVNLGTKNVISTNSLQAQTNREHQLNLNYYY